MGSHPTVLDCGSDDPPHVDCTSGAARVEDGSYAWLFPTSPSRELRMSRWDEAANPDGVWLFVGFDRESAVAHAVFVASVQKLASRPIAITTLALHQLKAQFRRERDPMQSTEFAFTRFLVPWLCGYRGWAIYADGDMICRADIVELWELRDRRYAVQVVKRDWQAPGSGRKFLGRRQTGYERKNWSSLMLLNCGACVELTKEIVESESGLWLHQFKWLDDSQIGELPKEWNHLVGVDEPNPDAKIAHFTLGMPFWKEYSDCEFSDEWRIERAKMLEYAAQPEKQLA